MKRLLVTAGLLLAVPLLAPAQDADYQHRAEGYGFIAGEWKVGSGWQLITATAFRRQVEMGKTIAIAASALLLVVPARGRAQTKNRYCCEGYVFFGRRTMTPGTSVAGVGGDAFIYKGLAAGGDVGTTVGNPDDRITIGSAGLSYHFLCCRAEGKVEPFVGGGFSYLAGDINTHGYVYPNDPGNDRAGRNFSQGLIAWPTKHVGARFEVREYRMFVSYGALENIIPGGKFVEFRVAVTLR